MDFEVGAVSKIGRQMSEAESKLQVYVSFSNR